MISIWYNMLIGKGSRPEYTRQGEKGMSTISMTDKQYQSILNLIAALVEKCKTEEEIKEAAKLIREVTQNFPAAESK